MIEVLIFGFRYAVTCGSGEETRRAAHSEECHEFGIDLLGTRHVSRGTTWISTYFTFLIIFACRRDVLRGQMRSSSP